MGKASIVIRTYNEEKHLPELLRQCEKQTYASGFETVIVDSGSTDRTLEIANDFKTRIVHIEKEEFTFGRSLNYGCDAAEGDYLVFISGHCIPIGESWLASLVHPFKDESIAMSYGRQLGVEQTHFSEHQIFTKFFPKYDKIPQEGFFANNANAAIRKSLWLETPFDESLTGLEDMDWAKKHVAKGKQVAYVASASVHHIHDETWRTIRLRYEREAIALQKIMPEVHMRLYDFARFYMAAVLSDWGKALGEKCFLRNFFDIVLFRFFQYYGSYRGNHELRKLSREMKRKYFYPV